PASSRLFLSLRQRAPATFFPPWRRCSTGFFSPTLALRSFAFRFLATAAAFEALVAIALRCSAVSVLARASPPRLAIIDRYFETVDLRMSKTIARSLPGTVEIFGPLKLFLTPQARHTPVPSCRLL